MCELVLDANARIFLQYLLDARSPLCVPADLRALLERGAHIIASSRSTSTEKMSSDEESGEELELTHEQQSDTNASTSDARSASKQELLRARISQPLLDALRDSIGDLRVQPSALVFLRLALKFARGTLTV